MDGLSLNRDMGDKFGKGCELGTLAFFVGWNEFFAAITTRRTNNGWLQFLRCLYREMRTGDDEDDEDDDPSNPFFRAEQEFEKKTRNKKQTAN